MASGYTSASNYDNNAISAEVPPGFVKLYHYTDFNGAQGILNSNLTIRQSTNKADGATAFTNTDAMFGEGTYLTDKCPTRHSKLDIAKDIWVNPDKFHNRMVKEGRTDFVFIIIIQKRLVQEKVKYPSSILYSISITIQPLFERFLK